MHRVHTQTAPAALLRNTAATVACTAGECRFLRRDLLWPVDPTNDASVSSIQDSDPTARPDRPKCAAWIDLVAPSEAELAAVGREFGLDSLLLEALARPARRPGFTMFGDVGLLVAYAATPRLLTRNTARRHMTPTPMPVRRPRAVDVGLPWLVTRRFRADQVQLAIRDDLMITVRAGPVVDVETAWDRWAAQCASAQPHCGLPAYFLLDTIVDTYIPILDGIIEDVGDVERRLLDGNIDAGKALDLQDLFRCKRDLAQFGRVVNPQRAAITALWRLAHELVHADAPTYFQDVADHLVRLAQNVDNYHDMLESTLNAYLVLVGNAKNDIMKRLTSVTILACIPTLITAWYGGNFHAPEFEVTYGYPLAVAFTLGALGLGHGYLRRRGFI